jgi:hypothetical protein
MSFCEGIYIDTSKNYYRRIRTFVQEDQRPPVCPGGLCNANETLSGFFFVLMFKVKSVAPGLLNQLKGKWPTRQVVFLVG